jgi:hypothetical protein
MWNNHCKRCGRSWKDYYRAGRCSCCNSPDVWADEVIERPAPIVVELQPVRIQISIEGSITTNGATQK